jgi:hypothetical protein
MDVYGRKFEIAEHGAFQRILDRDLLADSRVDLLCRAESLQRHSRLS